MNSTVSALAAKLSTTNDGQAAFTAIKALGKHARKGNAEAKRALAEYIGAGKVKHMRDFACSCLAEVVSLDDDEFSETFMQGLASPLTRYWCILGYINTAGSAAYKRLVKLAEDKSVPVEDRAHAVKCLSTCSKQAFDRGLPLDPGEWTVRDLPLKEIAAWAKAGYPTGQGYSPPDRHPALDKPKTPLEKIASRLDRKLAKQRQAQQDLAAPDNWLAVADPSALKPVTARWNLPSIYFDFLSRFSPIQVTLQSRRFNSGLQLFGAGELIAGQDGYAFNPLTKKAIRGWPKHLVVIASHAGDPFVLDLSQSDGTDAPVLSAEHGTGSWEFAEVASSFTEFLRSLAK